MDNGRSPEHVAGNTEIVNGRYQISVDAGKLYLAVYPPQGNGTPVSQQAILGDIADRQAEHVDQAAVERTIREASGEPVTVAEMKSAAEPEIDIHISKDKMEASLDIKMVPGCRPVTFEEVMERIKKMEISYGIDPEALHQAVEKPTSKVICAKGIKPVDGDNGVIKYYVDLENKGRPVEGEDGKMDYKNLNLFTVVRQDDILAEKFLPTAGTPGYDVFGNEVPAKPGKDVLLPVGKNVQVVDTNKIAAAITGQLLVVNNKLSVVPLIEVKGDVDLSTGNIEFMGAVIIHGSVQTGFTVKAEGNVDINGNVSGGIVEGKNVNVRQGIQGMSRGYVKATENVTAKFVENAVVSAGQDVLINDVVLNSRISAGKRVIVEGKRGLIVGGQVCAGEEIRAKVAGNNLSTNTDLEVGVNPQLRDEFQHLRKEIKKLENDLEQAQKALNILRSMDQSTLTPEKHAMLLKLTKAQFHLIGQVETMRNRIAEIELAFEEMRYGKIRVADAVYSGVKITVGTLVRPIRDMVKFSSFYAEDGEVKVGSYK
ncbi:MAG TPA: FapA family protein [Patescibacteria group bacterium]|nr:FapA family protein [Patescibacteria group bacterium]